MLFNAGNYNASVLKMSGKNVLPDLTRLHEDIKAAIIRSGAPLPFAIFIGKATM